MKLIDIGALNGDSALHFINYPDIDHIDAYEPNEFFEDLWIAISNFYVGINFYARAVYTYTGEIEYTLRPSDLPLGSSVIKEKHGWGQGRIIKIPCVDILKIIPEEKFCLKIDAEGAEYDILERLVASGKSSLVDRLYVEWHDSKMSSDNSLREIELKKHFGNRIKTWL